MTRTLIGSCAAAALGFALTASAQQPQPQPQPSQPTPAAQAPAATAEPDHASKLNGCLKAGMTPGTFELATGKKDKTAPSSSDAASPAQPPASTSSQAPTQDAMAKAGTRNVKLVLGSGVDLAAHVNHQVELSGSWQQPMASAAGADATKAGKTFTVTSVKMISATCTAGTD
jgi:hypothetical protein